MRKFATEFTRVIKELHTIWTGGPWAGMFSPSGHRGVMCFPSNANGATIGLYKVYWRLYHLVVQLGRY